MSSDEEEYPEGHDVVVSKGACPECGSVDNNKIYADGHEHCFTLGCGHHTAPTAGPRLVFAKPGKVGPRAIGRVDAASNPNAWKPLEKRRIKTETMRRYGYFVGTHNGTAVQVAPYYSPDGELALQKLRYPDKTFPVLRVTDEAPALNDCWLFGRHVYGDRFDRRVVITEGELDALSVAQVADFKYAVCSVNAGAGAAAKCLKANYLWLDRFAEIILWLDDDEPGRAATEECAKLFKVGKVRVAKVDGYKDASDVLQAGLPGEIEAAIYKATAWRPRGIVNAADRPDDVLAPKDEDLLHWSYPPQFAKLNELTGGIFLGEVVYHVAGTGVGKSTALREIQAHLAKEGVKIGVMSFEDTRRESKLGIMSIFASRRLHMEPLPDEDMLKLHASVFGPRLVELFDPETAEWSVDAIMGYVRYCAKALDCKVIFIDPLSFIAAGLSLADDERRVLDKAARDLAALAKELNINIQVSHHLTRPQGVPHEEGAPTSLNQVRGSGGLANFAMQLIGWERNGHAEGDAWRITQSRVLKARRNGGKQGVADVLIYGDDGRLRPSPDPFPQPGKPNGKTANTPFGPVTDY